MALGEQLYGLTESDQTTLREVISVVHGKPRVAPPPWKRRRPGQGGVGGSTIVAGVSGSFLIALGRIPPAVRQDFVDLPANVKAYMLSSNPDLTDSTLCWILGVGQGCTCSVVTGDVSGTGTGTGAGTGTGIIGGTGTGEPNLYCIPNIDSGQVTLVNGARLSIGTGKLLQGKQLPGGLAGQPAYIVDVSPC
jgi:hypothetical protein